MSVSGTVLSVLSWLDSRLVAMGRLRDKALAIGLAPSEIASVVTTALAKGEAALAAAVLIGSTLITVAVAGPLLALEVGSSSVHPGSLIVSLALVVGLPLTGGLVLSGTDHSPPDTRARRWPWRPRRWQDWFLVSAEILSR